MDANGSHRANKLHMLQRPHRQTTSGTTVTTGIIVNNNNSTMVRQLSEHGQGGAAEDEHGDVAPAEAHRGTRLDVHII